MTEFVKSYSAAYVNAKKNDWLKDYTWFRAPLRVKKVLLMNVKDSPEKQAVDMISGRSN